jgi:Mor family transcriptional regulator
VTKVSYKKAIEILPEHLLKELQKYIDGELIYIPKIEENKMAWGENSETKEKNLQRNDEIYQSYLEGSSTRELADLYFLSQKTVQKIIAKSKKLHPFDNQRLSLG